MQHHSQQNHSHQTYASCALHDNSRCQLCYIPEPTGPHFHNFKKKLFRKPGRRRPPPPPPPPPQYQHSTHTRYSRHAAAAALKRHHCVVGAKSIIIHITCFVVLLTLGKNSVGKQCNTRVSIRCATPLRGQPATQPTMICRAYETKRHHSATQADSRTG